MTATWPDRVARMREPRPYPVAPLADALGIDQTDTNRLSLRIGVGRRWIRRYRTWGLTLTQADTWATRAGLHAADVWPRWYDDWLQGAALLNAHRTHCPRGHAYDRINAQGARYCSTCHLDAVRRYRAKKSTKPQVTALISEEAS